MKPQRLSKKQALEHWRALEDAPLAPEPVPYKHSGSTFERDGVRITGSREFIDAVLSRLRPLLAFENGTTRLELAYQQATDRDTGYPLDSWSCYVKVHERGAQAQAANAFASALGGREVVVSRGY